LEGSARLWEEHPDAMHAALARHDVILRSCIEQQAGHVVKMRGDGVHAAFATADAAIVAAVSLQHAFFGEDWGVTGSLRVRIGIHSGAATLRDGDYFGSTVNRAARLMECRLRDLTRAERVLQVSAAMLPTSFPPLRALESYPTNLSAPPRRSRGWPNTSATTRRSSHAAPP
jgi:hypothetical protein